MRPLRSLGFGPRAPRWSAGRCHLVGFQGFVGGGVDFEQLYRIAPQCCRMPDYGAAALFFEQHAVMDVMRKHKVAIAPDIDIDDLNVGVAPRPVILPGESAANLSIADIAMDRRDRQRRP